MTVPLKGHRSWKNLRRPALIQAAYTAAGDKAIVRQRCYSWCYLSFIFFVLFLPVMVTSWDSAERIAKCPTRVSAFQADLFSICSC
jgi:hypothetical protein